MTNDICNLAMFTGIIEELGRIDSITRRKGGIILKVRSTLTVEDVKVGDSIAINGVCLTVSELNRDSFLVFVMDESLKETNLSFLHRRSYVNLERALRLTDRLSGHIVYGHIDGLARLIAKTGDSVTLSIPQKVAEFAIQKGSIALDGISLTIQSKRGNIIKVAITPFTREHTNIKYWRVGSKINVETDKLIGRSNLSTCR